MTDIIDWDFEMIREPGSYRGIPLSQYHRSLSLLPGPSVSKSNIKNIVPPAGSPKKFWQTWKHNPKHKTRKATAAMTFGRAVHALLLGDENFAEGFVVRPEEVQGEKYQGNKKVWRDWYKEQDLAGLEVVTKEQLEQIRAMSDDAATHPFVASGGLNGNVEISMFAKDPKTGIWMMSRPDVDVSDGDYADLKTAADLSEPFLKKQIEGAGYYIQGALTRRLCRLLGKPFRTFSFVYVLSDDEYADTDFRVLSEEDLDLGDRVIDYALAKIRQCLSTGDWQGMSVYSRENTPISMPGRTREGIINALSKEGF